MSSSPLPRLGALAVLAVLVHGYHLGADDAAIYLPAVKRAADPALYPFGAEFFLSQTSLSIFPQIVGIPARFSHLPVDAVIFAWHIFSIFLLLFAAWQLAACCFQGVSARWSAVAFLAVTLSVPVAGTALVLMDPFLTARSLSAPATLFAVAAAVSGKPRQSLAWLAITAALHPLMAIYGAAFLCTLVLRRLPPVSVPALTAALAVPFIPEFGRSFFRVFARAEGAARDCLLARPYLFVTNWAWYEWLGVVAPLALLSFSLRVTPRGTLPAFRRTAVALVPFGLIFTAVAVVVATTAPLESLNRLQPMRAFHLLYLIFFVLLGGLLGEYLLGNRPLRWVLLFGVLALGMVWLQEDAFPASRHVEWPGSGTDRNSWISAFLWVRDHTPKDALFALDPDYLAARGEDTHGFRAIAERSVLADRLKDSAEVSLFPHLASDWQNQVAADAGLDHFQAFDFNRLLALYPVTWIVVARPAPAGLTCPYQNADLAVCRL